ncbi:MAG: AAA family ATPase [Myxococcales bacterium]|nr:AAA family ATPase [Myxococcales bacterium]
MELVLLCGIQATGKSSFYAARFFATHVRVSLDMLRTRHRERLLVQACLDGQQAFVVDNTNVTASERARYIEPARAAGFRVVGYYFASRVAEALARNAGREGDARVPDRGVRGTFARLELPDPGEGFDALHFVSLGPDRQFVVEPWRGRTAG